MAFIEGALVLHGEKPPAALEAIRQFAGKENISLRFGLVADFLVNPEETLEEHRHVVVVSTDSDITRVIHHAREYDFSVGVVPVSSQSNLFRLFKIPRKESEAIALAFADTARAIDVLLCNDEVALGMVMFGETPFIDRRSKTYQSDHPRLMRVWQLFALLYASVRNLFRISPFPITLVTGKDVSLKTSVTGMVLIENDVDNAAAHLLNTSISVLDGKVSAVLIAPKSITEYLAFLFTSLITGSGHVKRLPGAISYIKTGYLRVEGHQPMTYYLDGLKREASVVELQLHSKSVQMNLSDAYHARHGTQSEQKDTMKVDNLPQNEARLAMIQRKLPFFTHALEDDFKDLFLLLKDNARVKPDYVALMFLSTVLAALGMFLNSAAVIIGAMVLAPLMAPIVSMSMGVLRNDSFLFRNALLSIAAGVGICLVTAAVVAWIVPLQRITPEIAARLQPSLLDLGVAVASGVAGAYAHARESIMKSLPGVAIAVALVPPLCVAGIGLGWMNFEIISGAMLLFLTNLMGIALAASLTFLVLGYAPIKRATRGLGWSVAVMFVIAIPLYFSFDNMLERWQVERSLVDEVMEINGKAVRLQDISVSVGRDAIHVTGTAASPEMLSAADFAAIRQHLNDRWERPLSMELGYRIEVPSGEVYGR